MSANFIATKVKALERCVADRSKKIETMQTLLTKVNGSEQGDPLLVEEVNKYFAELKQSRNDERDQSKLVKKALLKQIGYKK